MKGFWLSRNQFYLLGRGFCFLEMFVSNHGSHDGYQQYAQNKGQRDHNINVIAPDGQ